MTKTHQKNGFTLVELLVVATIIIVLGAIGMVSFTSASVTSRDGKRKSDMEIVRQALVMYKIDNGTYPGSPSGDHFKNYENLLNLPAFTSTYLSPPHPLDPKAPNTRYQYTLNTGNTTFCLCAQLEKSGAGNASGLGSGVCNWSAGGSYHCVKNP